MKPNWLDRAISFLAPRTGLSRVRARAAAEILVRHYEGAATGRRTQGWRRSSGDANAAQQGALAQLRNAARDLVRNNGHAESALTTICDHVVGWGIVAKAKPKNARAAKLWEEWAGTRACDADGQDDFAGLQHLAMRTIVESGEVLVRRRFRRPGPLPDGDGLPIPMQIQVLEPDYLDTDKTMPLPNGGRIVHGVELDPLGRRAAYWLFEEHPGSVMRTGLAASKRIPAESVLHVYRKDRASQVRGASWFAPILLKFHDYDDYDDATLMKQKIAACLAVITSDVDGTAPALGTASGEGGLIDELEPGMVLNVPPGRTVSTVQPPTVREYADYSRVTLRTIAAGFGVSYEDLTGDYSVVNFSSARMARLRHWARVENWRWRTLIPGFCMPVWGWAMEVAGIFAPGRAPRVGWTPPPMPMIEPDKEGLAYQRNVRSGIMTLSEAIRERGYDPEDVLAEMAADNKKIDQLELVLDSDPRKTSQAGLTQARPAGTVIPPAGEPADEPPPAPATPPAPPGAPVPAADDDNDDGSDDDE